MDALKEAEHNRVTQFQFNVLARMLEIPEIRKLMSNAVLDLFESLRKLPAASTRAFLYPDRSPAAFENEKMPLIAVLNWLGASENTRFMQISRDGLPPIPKPKPQTAGARARDQMHRDKAYAGLETLTERLAGDVKRTESGLRWYRKAMNRYVSGDSRINPEKLRGLVLEEARRLNDEWGKWGLSSMSYLSHRQNVLASGYGTGEFDKKVNEFLDGKFIQADQVEVKKTRKGPTFGSA